ncbi:MAG: hypothetical protein IT385_16485 [Deltaproteobacteria bacterium]|nr:hypothetical protein [Deltaproteobacteria bacterium]
MRGSTRSSCDVPQTHRRTLGWLLGSALITLLPSDYHLVLRWIGPPWLVDDRLIGDTLAMLVGYLAAALPAFVLTLFLAAPKELGARPHAGSWEVAMRGARLVRSAEIARIALVAGVFVLGLVTAASRSFDLMVALSIGSAVGACAIACVSLVGYARLRDIPLTSDARGPAAATFALAMAALAFTLTSLVVGLLAADVRGFGRAGPDPLVAGPVMYGLATTAAFVNTIRRAGRALADGEVVARARTAIVTWLLGPALAAVTAFAVPLPTAAAATFALAGIALQIVGVVALIQGRRALELALARRDRADRSETFA